MNYDLAKARVYRAMAANIWRDWTAYRKDFPWRSALAVFYIEDCWKHRFHLRAELTIKAQDLEDKHNGIR